MFNFFLLKPASFYKLFAGLGSTNKSALVLSSSLSFLLPQYLWQELSFLSFCTIRLRWVPDTRSSRRTTRLMSWSDGERYSRPLQFLVVSPLISRIHSCLFSDWRRTVSSKNLCSVVTLAVCSLVYAATDTAYC